MGFWDFFDTKKKDLPPGKKTHYLGDLHKTAVLQKLFQIPKERRDTAWQQQFLANVADAAFRCAQPQVSKGPDGFPYFILFLPLAQQAFQAYTIRHMKDDFLLNSGYGIVINPHAGTADWVFSYGDIVNFQISGEFYSAASPVEIAQKEILEKDEKVLVAQPSEKYFPKQARTVIRDYLKAMGIEHPKVMLLTRMIQGLPVQELAFNVRPQDFPTPKHYSFTMEHLSWYLPRHYIVLTLPANIDEKGFVDL